MEHEKSLSELHALLLEVSQIKLPNKSTSFVWQLIYEIVRGRILASIIQLTSETNNKKIDVAIIAQTLQHKSQSIDPRLLALSLRKAYRIYLCCLSYVPDVGEFDTIYEYVGCKALLQGITANGWNDLYIDNGTIIPELKRLLSV